MEITLHAGKRIERSSNEMTDGSADHQMLKKYTPKPTKTATASHLIDSHRLSGELLKGYGKKDASSNDFVSATPKLWLYNYLIL